MQMSSRIIGGALLACLYSAPAAYAQQSSASSVQASTSVPKIPSPSGPFGIGGSTGIPVTNAQHTAAVTGKHLLLRGGIFPDAGPYQLFSLSPKALYTVLIAVRPLLLYITYSYYIYLDEA